MPFLRRTQTTQMYQAARVDLARPRHHTQCYGVCVCVVCALCYVCLLFGSTLDDT